MFTFGANIPKFSLPSLARNVVGFSELFSKSELLHFADFSTVVVQQMNHFPERTGLKTMLSGEMEIPKLSTTN